MRDATYGRDLLLGSDGRYHFPGDRIDTYRDDNGRAHADNGRFITDDNLPPTKTIDARAHPDLATRRTYDFDGSAAVDEAGRHAVDARQDIAAQRQQLWDDRLAPVADALRPHGVTVDSASVSKNNLLELTLAAAPYLDRAQRAELQNAGSQYAELTDQLVGASERVGTAGGALVVDREFPDARVLSSTDDSRGTPHNIDRVVYLIESAGSVVAIEEKGAGSGLGSRMVENPAEPAGPHIRAEQCSPEYLRHMLQNDKKLGETLGADPDLRAAIQTTINGTDPGNIRYLHVHTSTDGLVTATDYIIDDDRLGRATIRVTGDPRETEGSPEHEIRRGT